MKPGPKSKLTSELERKIRDWVIAGKSFVEIAKLSEIPLLTIQDWHSKNYKGFRDQMMVWRQEFKLSKADGVIDEMLTMETDEKTIKVKADMAKFVKERLDKANYSSRSELTGKDGSELKTGVVVLPAQKEK